MDSLKSIWSFISVVNDILSPAIDVFNSEEFNGVFNSTASDDTNNSDNEETAETEK